MIFDAFWQMMAGLGIFLLGMSLIEKALEYLGGRGLRLFLQKHTNKPFKAVIGGTLATAVLQSSSVISLIILAFVGAQMMEMRNALGVIIGANLGTTFTGWIVATVGFKLKIELFAHPLIAVGLAGMLLIQGQQRLRHYAQLVAGLGLLFFGLSLMKTAMEGVSDDLDLSILRSYGVLVYFLFGFAFTAVIQSSSATMALTLSALSMGIVNLESAAALIIGADLGTTITVMLGAINGTAPKKRVALFHFTFNVFVDLFALVFLGPLLHITQWLVPSSNPLFILVGFHNLFNVLGITIFLPFLSNISLWLEKRFLREEISFAKHLPLVTPNITEAAHKALYLEVRRLVVMVARLNMRWAHLDLNEVTFQRDELLDKSVSRDDLKQRYNYIKHLEGEILHYMASMRGQESFKDDVSTLNSYTAAVRNAVRSVKAIKNARHDVEHFENTARDEEHRQFLTIIDDLVRFYQSFDEIWSASDLDTKFEELIELKQLIESQYDTQMNAVYSTVGTGRIDKGEVSTLLNVIRQIHTSNTALLNAAKEIYFSDEQIQIFDNLPPMRT